MFKINSSKLILFVLMIFVVLVTVAARPLQEVGPAGTLEINAESLTIILGVVLTLGASYIPGVSTWYDKLGEKADGTNDNGTLKRLFMLGILLLITGSIYGLSCTSWGPLLRIAATCDQPGAANLILAFIYAIMANQGVYKISPEAPWVKQARELRSGQASLQVGQG